MNKPRRFVLVLSCVFALCFGVTQNAYGMHIMEGYLPLGFCVAWGVLSLPFVVAGVFRIRSIISEHRKTLLLFAMVGAFAFLLSALKIPSVTGSSSHPTGMGLGAILFGPTPMAVIGLIVLLFQAILLAHGGLTTLGANTFSMAIIGPFLSFGIYRLCKKLKVNRSVGIFLAACIGSVATYCVTSVQLGIAYPSEIGGIAASILQFLGVFAITQLPLSVIEGLLTVVVIIGLETYAKKDLVALGFLKAPVREEEVTA